MNESDFVQGLREKNPAAVRHLSECYLPSVWRFVYMRVGGDQHLAEDIVSETVLALVKIVAEADAKISNPGGWLRTVAGNKVNDHFRAAARVQHLIDEAKQTTETADHNDAPARQELIERRAEIRQAMDGLTDQYRMALEWKYIDRLSVRQIAERLDVTEKAAESVLFRARREFRDRLTRGDREEPPGTGGAGCGRDRHSEQRQAESHNTQSSTETRIPVNNRK